MKIAFFCSTPYQIINALNIKLSHYQNDNADIYVLKHFHSFDWLCERLSSLNIFDSVYKIDDGDFDYRYNLPTVKRYIKKGLDFIFCKRVVEPYIDTAKKYDAIYYTFPNMVIEFACYYYISQNKHIKFYMFEDGFSSYSDDLIAVSKAKSLFLKITGRKQFLDTNHSLFLYAPELFCKTRINKNYKVLPISKIDSTNSLFLNYYNTLFDFDNICNINQKVIFFEQPYEDEIVNQNIRNCLDNVLENINKDDVCIKLHPRGKKELYGGISTYSNSAVPAEVIYLNMNDLMDKVLISSVSTACLSPKLIFDKEPTLILLYKYLKLEQKGIVTQGLVDFIEKVVTTYKDKSKIMIPETKEEFLQCIRSISNG